MRQQLRMAYLLLVFGLGLAAACSSPTEAPVSGVGFLFGNGQHLEIVVPDSVRARTAFDISVRTSGNHCVSFGGTEIEVTDRIVNFKPFDLFQAGPCFDDLHVFEHRASAQFDTPGPVVVRIHGRLNVFDGARDTTRDTVVVRTVEVW